MEEFYEEMSEKLYLQNSKLSESVEADHKRLMQEGYDCKSRCYRSDLPIEKCGECASDCNKPIAFMQTELVKLFDSVQSRFEDCLKHCERSCPPSEDSLKDCSLFCYDQSLTHFAEAKTAASSLFSKHLSRSP